MPNVKHALNSFVSFIFQVHLEDNQLRDLSANTFSGLSNLSRVDLRRNLLEKFPLNALALTLTPSDADADARPKAEFLLEGNPLRCDCEMEWVQRINQLAQKQPRYS